jgi:hypothetical protein
MRKDQWERLGKLWNVVGLPVYDDFINAIGGTEIKLDTIAEATVFYGALKRLPIKDQIQVNSNVTILRNPLIANLLIQWLKRSNEMGEAAVRESREIINQKYIQ